MDVVDGAVRISTQKWMDWYVYMQDNSEGNVRGWKGDPGQQGHFVFTKVAQPSPDGTVRYLVSPKEWPNWYMYMQNNGDGNVRGWPGDPGEQGHWIITRKGTVIVGGREIPTYVLHTERWPGWYMYMQDNAAGNVGGWNGDPGIQGYFIFERI